jgi:hypothetical protein
MNKILLLTLILISQVSYAEKSHDSHSNDGSHDMSKDKKIDGPEYKLNTKRYTDFIEIFLTFKSQ